MAQMRIELQRRGSVDALTTKPRSKTRGRFWIHGNDTVKISISVLGFFLGRAVMFQMMNPVGVAVLSGMLGTGYTFYITVIFLLAGLATKLRGVYLLQYVICFGLLCGVQFFTEKVLV